MHSKKYAKPAVLDTFLKNFPSMNYIKFLEVLINIFLHFFLIQHIKKFEISFINFVYIQN